MVKRIYFLTSEIVPFAESYELAEFSKEVPVVFIDKKFDFRVMMPKYEFISERRYILREVIRLRDMELDYRGNKVKASVKSAFIPNTKVQVYFLEHEVYYDNNDNELYPAKPAKGDNCNADRFAYFSTAALTTLNYLRWKPEIIVCNDWQMALIPLFIKSGLLDAQYFEGVKLIQVVHSKSDLSKFNVADYQAVGLKEFGEKNAVKGNVDSLALSIPLCDHTIFVERNNNLLETYKADAEFKGLLEDNQSKISSYQLTGNTPDEWQGFADEIIKVSENLLS